MNFEEHAAKPIIAKASIPVPRGGLAMTPDDAAAIAEPLGPVVVKAQVPSGKRGKAGGIKPAKDGAEAANLAGQILGMKIAGHCVEKVLIEEQVAIARELYAAVLNDPASRGPLVMFSGTGGMEIEEIAESNPAALRKHSVDITKGFSSADAAALVSGQGLSAAEPQVADCLVKLYRAYRETDAELLEINPLVITESDQVIALDCKLTLDDGALARHQDIASSGTPDKLTDLEARGADLGLKYIQLDGSVGVLANGAGLTMTTMDAVIYFGGEPANFLEIGGEAYTKATDALGLVLSNPNVKSLLVNFCGAFARCDVMTEGVVQAWETLKPDLPVFFSIHGTGEVEAKTLLKARLGMEPFELMDDAVKAAIAAAQ